MNVEKLFLKAIDKTDTSKELKVSESDFHEEFNRNQIESELHLILTIFKNSMPIDFRDICKTLQNIDKENRQMIQNIWTIIQIMFTSRATSATPLIYR